MRTYAIASLPHPGSLSSIPYPDDTRTENRHQEIDSQEEGFQSDKSPQQLLLNPDPNPDNQSMERILQLIRDTNNEISEKQEALIESQLELKAKIEEIAKDLRKLTNNAEAEQKKRLMEEKKNASITRRTFRILTNIATNPYVLPILGIAVWNLASSNEYTNPYMLLAKASALYASMVTSSTAPTCGGFYQGTGGYALCQNIPSFKMPDFLSWT